MHQAACVFGAAKLLVRVFMPQTGSRRQEEIYLAACRQPLHDIALLMLETGLRIGETINLEWTDIILEPVNGARFGFLRVRDGKSKTPGASSH
jgi:integrase